MGLQLARGTNKFSVFKAMTVGLLGCDKVYLCKWMPVFRSNIHSFIYLHYIGSLQG
jgi:hypothetical protein